MPSGSGPLTVVLGDSWAAGSGTDDPARDSWPALLAADRKWRVRVDAYGSTGFATRGYCPGKAVSFPERVGEVLAMHPRRVIVEGGINDAVNAKSGASIAAGERRVLTALAAVPEIVVVGPAPAPAAHGRAPAVDAALALVARAAHRQYVSMLGLRLSYEPSGLHTDAAGQRTFARAVETATA